MTRSVIRAALLGLGVLGLSACASSDAPSDAAGSDDPLSGQLTIFAAASLATAFDDLAAGFEDQHPDLDVRPISYDGSSVLATQLIEGAPADVFASADQRTMGLVVDAGAAANPVLFASNTLVIVVPAGNPAGIDSIVDLADPDLTVVLCAAEVPCGSAAQTLLGYGDVHVDAASLEQNVTAVLTKVAAGEADAGLVYATDVQGRDDVSAVIPEGTHSVVNHYPIAVTTGANNARAAQAFVDYVLSSDGQDVLADHGFGAP
ncbi:molybdate ABC transporter substrate-binding protein [Microbacterium sp. C7(2022)]|uniref:molybdate ABC transporter substrate-binding protein n=1 Tax=Microbacterium sp. C7(2022) TaxID=2992759 RepID=UPI00237C315E|nr:molybdate ABC transporter substrate-binding protein [Microbacterium sp. C7(2022)]MDE0546065.1 molybdate ABC transporter substrate-binding protein [Microbacterium sp. C7(2022)]